ncbi:MAG TPA: DivIVA domain-containing protein [Longimicrobiales bacterium]
MIDLTPLEVRKKKEDFRRALRGYEPVDVDTFLDLVADRMEQLVRENLALSERAGRLDDEIAAYRERERALTDALVSAQEIREELRKQAARDAEELRRAAEEEVERLRAEMRKALEREEMALRDIRARRAQLVQAYRSLLERELKELNLLVQTLELEEDTPAVNLPSIEDFGEPLLSTAEPAAEWPAAAQAARPEAQVEKQTEKEKEEKKDAPAPAPAAGEAVKEDYSEGLEWLSSLLREDP